MAKNLKIQIKNSQLAEAINMQGIKAQLKKHRDEEEDIEASSSQEGKATEAQEKGSTLTEKKKGKKKSSDEAIVKTSSQVTDESKKEVSVRKLSEKTEKKDGMHISSNIASTPVFSTLDEPISGKTSSSNEKSLKTGSSEFQLKEPYRDVKPSLNSSSAVHKKEPLQNDKSDNAAEIMKKSVSEEKSSPLFLSATKKNPDSLGPVLDKPQRPTSISSPSLPRRIDSDRGERSQHHHDRPAFSPRSNQFTPRDGYNSQSRELGGRDAHQRESDVRDRPQRPFQPRDSQQRPFQPRDSQQRSFSPRDSQQPSFQRDERFRGNGSPRFSDQPREGNFDQNRSFNRFETSQPRSGYSGPNTSRQHFSDQPRAAGSFSPRPVSSGNSYGPRPFTQRPSSPHSGAPYVKRGPQDGQGFKPQPFGSKADGFSNKPLASGWDRAQPQKEGFEERSQQRRLISQNEIDEKKNKFKDVKEGKTSFKKNDDKDFSSRIRHGFQSEDEDDERGGWKKRRSKGYRAKNSDIQEPIRPSKVKVRVPISVKDLAQEMKLKSSQLVTKLFLQGVIVTLNDLLDDETILQLLGHEFGCEIEIDTSEQERLKLSDKTIKEEIHEDSSELTVLRPPVVAFMGHVDHGKTSLIDAIRKTNKAQGEVGAITQHIGAFSCTTQHGPITILDTPGHEAFSAMRERGAEITDIVILVVAGDEGMKEQTIEAMNQAKASHSTIVVAINKCDKPAFDQEKVYRQLAEHELLPEAWGGQTITVNCSAATGEGIQELLEMIALQSEVLELKANPSIRARGSVIESEMYKGLGPVATVLVRNGSLKLGDALVFDYHWAKIKSMKDDLGRDVLIAGPSVPVRINGLSDFPAAGEEFVVVQSEKEAKAISDARQEGRRQLAFQSKKRISLENMAEKAGSQIKVLNVILRADVQGSLEALKTALMKIESKKVELNIVAMGVGEISESDVQLANASKSTIIGFHTQIESHAEPMVKELGVQYKLHDIIYHAQDDVRAMMKALLDKIPQEHDKGTAEVRAVFKSSQVGMIAGCYILDGSITRNCLMRVIRAGSLIWKGSISSLKRFKDDIKEVSKGAECGILLNGFNEFQVGDLMQAYEVTYLTQDL